METTAFPHPGPRPNAWRELGDLSDDSLVERARQRDLAACEALMRRHNRRLFRVTRGVLRDSGEAQAAVQRAYLRAFTRLDTAQPAVKFSASLTRLALDEALMMRHRAPGQIVSRDAAGSESLVAGKAAAADAPSADPFVEAAHARALLEHAIDALPDNFRMVFMMRAVEGLNVRETAESLGINSNTVRTRLFRANRLLRGELALRLRTESTEVFEFSAVRCDAVVAGVFEKLAG